MPRIGQPEHVRQPERVGQRVESVRLSPGVFAWLNPTKEQTFPCKLGDWTRRASASKLRRAQLGACKDRCKVNRATTAKLREAP